MTDSKKIDDGGQAFPNFPIGGGGRHPIYEGMSLRDHFAGQSICAIIERCGADHRMPHEHITDYFARKAYEVADAMLLARKGGEA